MLKQQWNLAKTEVLGLLKQSVRPEFLNRIDDIIMFTPLSKENIQEIVKLQFDLIAKRLLLQKYSN